MTQKALVCFKHKQYILLFPCNPQNKKLQKSFSNWHFGCPLQTVNLEELDKSYQCITERKREKLLKEIQNEIIQN